MSNGTNWEAELREILDHASGGRRVKLSGAKYFGLHQNVRKGPRREDAFVHTGDPGLTDVVIHSIKRRNSSFPLQVLVEKSPRQNPGQPDSVCTLGLDRVTGGIVRFYPSVPTALSQQPPKSYPNLSKNQRTRQDSDVRKIVRGGVTKRWSDQENS